MPALFALQNGCPVAWNCPSASLEIPSWSEPLMRAALQNSDYVAVRDEASRNALLRFTDEVVKVPDTCFGISRWIDRKSPSADYLQMRQAIGLTKPYIVVQSSHRATGFCDFIRRNREQFADYQFLSLPVGPALGDAHFVIADHFSGLVSLASWPNPMLLGELIAGASGVVGDSLHLAVAALSFKVPVFRPGHEFDGKFAILKRYANLHVFQEDGAIDPAWFKQNLNRREICPALRDSLQQLDLHWDRVAQCFAAGSNKERAKDVFASFAQRLPGLLENEARLAGELM
jgi:lipopolysaccharide transport system ATP-binding protein